MKKVTSVILILAMLVSVLALNGFAATPELDHDHEAECCGCTLATEPYSIDAVCTCGSSVVYRICGGDTTGYEYKSHSWSGQTCEVTVYHASTVLVCAFCDRLLSVSGTHLCGDSHSLCGASRSCPLPTSY